MSDRALAPDLARGVMLLLIVMSNTVFHLWAASFGPSGWHPVDGSAADRVVQFLMITMLDLRIYPLFAFLFGYGMVQLYRKRVEAGTPERRAAAVLYRRSLWLVVFGLVHAALLLGGDILSHYGVTGLILGFLLIRRSDRVLTVALVVMLLLHVSSLIGPLLAVGAGDLAGTGAASTEPSILAYGSGVASWPEAAMDRLATWSFLVVAAALYFWGTPALVLGFWAARRRILEQPLEHLRLLRRTAAVGVTVGWAGGLPLALAHVGVLDVPSNAQAEGGVFRTIAEVTGLFGGLGYVALFGLLAARLRRHGPGGDGAVTRAVTALGKRSLSGYLAHSAIFAPLLAAWGLGLGAHLSSATMALFAIGVWLVTVVAADALERRGVPGPAEWLLRRLAYGRRPRAAATTLDSAAST